MKKTQILKTLKEVGKPLTIEELSNKTDIPVPRLRMDLYRLQSEGKIESREKKEKIQWTIKVSKSIEEKYEKMSKKPTS
ncbi:MAG: hypothetical protein KGY45_01095 [Hadesarchaea archaeon]|nr:hypothetical protein [Hadesarchaea archaeon]